MDDKDVIIAQQQREIKDLCALVEQLREKIARLEKDSNTSSKPPSSDIINPPAKLQSKKKRKRGGQRGHKKHPRKPFPADEIDKTIIHELSENEVKRRGLIKLARTESALQQASLPQKLYSVVDHRVQLYKTPDGRIIRATLPPEVRKAGLFAPDMIALAGFFKGRCHTSYSTLQAIFSEVFRLDVSCGFLTSVCTKKMAAAIQPAYDEVLTHIQNANIVGSDETGHKNPAFNSAWTWCWQTPEAALFFNTNSRSSQVLKDILGDDFDGIFVCDFFSANKKFINDLMLKAQFCFAHLIRDIKFLTTLPLKNVVRWAEGLLRLLQKIFKMWKMRHIVHSGRYKKKIEKLRKAFLQKVRRPPNHCDAINIRKRFDSIGAKRYFLFMEQEGVPPTNNATEQAIRFVVIDRRVTQGTRSWAGMRFCERMWTIIATCIRQGKNVFEFLRNALSSTYAATPYPKLLT